MKFAALEVAPTTDFTWKPRAPLRYRFFAWLALKNRCTSDRLARRGLPHQNAFPFCDQHDETIDHLLVTCVFAREIWDKVCAAMGHTDGAPTAEVSLQGWCLRAGAHGRLGKAERAIHLLCLWELWKHRNVVVFDGAIPSIRSVLRRIASESKVWHLAGLVGGELDGFLAAVSRWACGE